MSTPLNTPTESHRSQGIEWLYSHFQTSLNYIRDDETKAEVNDWLSRVDQLPATNVLDHIERHLSDVRKIDDDKPGQYAMYREAQDGEAEFPESCADCEHYGVACPIFTGLTERDRRERLQRSLEDASETRIKTEYRRLAEDTGCHQITDAIANYEDRYKTLLCEGRELYAQTDIDVGRTDEQAEGARLASQAEGEP